MKAAMMERWMLRGVDCQGFLEGLLVLVAVACVPVMLLGKPYTLKKRHARLASQGGLVRAAALIVLPFCF